MRVSGGGRGGEQNESVQGKRLGLTWLNLSHLPTMLLEKYIKRKRVFLLHLFFSCADRRV